MFVMLLKPETELRL